MDIRNELFALRDEKYKSFQEKLMPTVNPDAVIGVRTPVLRKFAARVYRTDDFMPFLSELPHRYYEENNLHAMLLGKFDDFGKAVSETARFLPYIDNWATCDSLNPPIFAKKKSELLPYIETWIKSDKPYTIRFGIGMLRRYYLDDGFRREQADAVADAVSGEYYVNMMRAWYFAEMLVKRRDTAVLYLTENRLDAWTHNMTIRKASESRRVAPELKRRLKTLCRREHNEK